MLATSQRLTSWPSNAHLEKHARISSTIPPTSQARNPVRKLPEGNLNDSFSHKLGPKEDLLPPGSLASHLSHLQAHRAAHARPRSSHRWPESKGVRELEATAQAPDPLKRNKPSRVSSQRGASSRPVMLSSRPFFLTRSVPEPEDLIASAAIDALQPLLDRTVTWADQAGGRSRSCSRVRSSNED